jgi:hypothetical protein
VSNALQEALRRTNKRPISRFPNWVSQMTRKTRNLTRTLCEPCPYCEGGLLSPRPPSATRSCVSRGLRMNTVCVRVTASRVVKLLFEQERTSLKRFSGSMTRRSNPSRPQPVSGTIRNCELLICHSPTCIVIELDSMRDVTLRRRSKEPANYGPGVRSGCGGKFQTGSLREVFPSLIGLN